MRHPMNRSGRYQVLYRIAKLLNLQKRVSSQVFSVNIVKSFRLDYLQNTSVRTVSAASNKQSYQCRNSNIKITLARIDIKMTLLILWH